MASAAGSMGRPRAARDIAEDLLHLAAEVTLAAEGGGYNLDAMAASETVKLADRSVQTHLFRLAQEAVNNSIKHGKAKNIQINLQKTDEKCVLSIADDGKGFPPEQQIKLKGLGLRIMNFRAQKIGGELNIEPLSTGGTMVKCTFANS